MVRVLAADGWVWDTTVVTTPFYLGRSRKAPTMPAIAADAWSNPGAKKSKARNRVLDEAGFEPSSNSAHQQPSGC